MSKELRQTIDIYPDYAINLGGTDSFIDLRAVFDLYKRTFTSVDLEHIIYPFRLQTSLGSFEKPGFPHSGWYGLSYFSFITQDPDLLSGMGMSINRATSTESEYIVNLLKRRSPNRVREYGRQTLGANWTFIHEWQHLLNVLRGVNIPYINRNTDQTKFDAQELACDETALTELAKALRGRVDLPICLTSPIERLRQIPLLEG